MPEKKTEKGRKMDRTKIPKRVPISFQNLKKVEKRDAEIEIENRCEKSVADQQTNPTRVDPMNPWGAAGGRVERFVSEFLDCTSVV